MQKTAIAFVALPLAFAAAGYAGGQVLPAPAPKAPTDLASAEREPTAAALVLERLAEAEEAAPMTAKDGAVVPQEVQAKAKTTSDRTEANVVRLGRMRVPVYRAHSVTYVVSEIGVEMRDTDVATKFKDAENTSRLRDAVLASLHRTAEGLSLTGAQVETPKLAKTLAEDLRKGFGPDVAQVLLLSLLQAEVPRS